MRSILNLLSFVIIVLLIVSIAGLVKNVKEKKPIKKKFGSIRSLSNCFCYSWSSNAVKKP